MKRLPDIRTGESHNESKRSVSISRRNLVKQLGLAGLGFIIGTDTVQISKDDKALETSTKREVIVDSLSMETARSGPKKYDEWSRRISLPSIEIDETARPWTTEEMKAYFVPEGVDESDLKRIHERFSELKAEILAAQGTVTNIHEGSLLMAKFFDQLFREYHRLMPNVDLRGMKPGDLRFWATVNEINRLLIHQGEWFTLILEKENTSINFFQVEEVSSRIKSPIFTGGSYPSVTISGNEAAKRNPKAPKHEAMAEYVPQGNYIMYDMTGSEKVARQFEENLHIPTPNKGTPEFETWRNELRDNTLVHEGTHALLVAKYGLDLNDDKKVVAKRKGVINMGGKNSKMGQYQLRESDYNWATSRHLHELIARGYELKSSEDNAARVVNVGLASTGPNYRLANWIFINEMAKSGEFNQNRPMTLVNALQGKPTIPNEMARIAQKIPDEKLHKIGERMAKLGIYLVTK